MIIKIKVKEYSPHYVGTKEMEDKFSKNLLSSTCFTHPEELGMTLENYSWREVEIDIPDDVIEAVMLKIMNTDIIRN